MQLFIVASGFVLALMLGWRTERYFHNRRLRRIDYRVHVNGIRGKSTVTRLVAGLFRSANVQTVAKTTGSAACVIDSCGNDQAIVRKGSPTILEQVEIVRGLARDVKALVIECMAIKPQYQKICEEKIVQSNIGIITNVREDHQDELGYSLEEIAGNLLNTCPFNGVLITSEQNRGLLRQFRAVARQRNTTLIVADPDVVSDSELENFAYVSFKENVAIGIALAEWLGIPRELAMQGMLKAAPDPGVLRFVRKRYRGRSITFADLFAVNDRESVIACYEKIKPMISEETCCIGLLNNREDREQRALQFAQIAANDLKLDLYGLLGAYESRVEAELNSQGVGRSEIIPLGAGRGLEGESLMDRILECSEAKDLLIMGLVNIHTRQAESLREWFSKE